MTPIILIGNNLGERHYYLNSTVNEAYRKPDFGSLEDIPEHSPIDRIYKINLALKLRNADYIIKNLKDDDMMYVSKALKCKWLLEPEFQHILNPEYLESCLYPSMMTTAVTKMKHWVFLNLKDPERCKLFFLYYCDTNFKLAVKFLRNCSAEFIMEQFSKHMQEITPHDFKIFCEKEPLVAEIFFDAITTDEEIKKIYLSKEKQYFSTLKSLLKRNPTFILDVAEKYFNKWVIKPFSPKSTKFILKNYRTRFSQKPELYTALLLHLPTLATCLNTEEAVDLTLTLARDKFLLSQNWFNYPKIEPIIKRIKPKDRGAIKNKIFVKKDVGIMTENWPYEIPSSPVRVKKIIPIFKDREYNPPMSQVARPLRFGTASKTMLDKSFDEYRVASFNKVLFELSKKLRAEGSAINRNYMMLVLIKKSGGHEKNIANVMQVLSHYKNEPAQNRAFIVHSLVTCAQIWRVENATWKKFLEFAHGLGLDGKRPEAYCKEGIHAVLIKKLIDGKYDSEILSLYLKNYYTTLEEYSFSKSEKKAISNILPNFIFEEACKASNEMRAIITIEKLLGILTTFKLSIETYPGLISKIKSLAKTNARLTSRIILRLYTSRIARRELFKVNFAIMETEHAYLNALRHDTEVISPQKLVKFILDNTKRYQNTPNISKPSTLSKYRYQPKSKKKPKLKDYNKFFRKISIYFNEKDGLGSQFLNVLKSEDRNKILAKPLCLLLGDELMSYIKNVDSLTVDTKDKIFAAAIRANAHLARPALNIDKFDWKSIGTKAVANKVLACRNTEVNKYIQKLLENKQTIKLACLLAKRNGNYEYVHCLSILSKTKPTAGLKSGFQMLKGQGNSVEINIWDTIKPLMENFDVIKMEDSKMYFKFPNAYLMPLQIRAEYTIMLYTAYRKISISKSMFLMSQIEYLLPNINEEFIVNVIAEFLNNDMLELSEKHVFNNHIQKTCQYIRIIIKYLLLCKTEECQQTRYDSIGTLLLDKMEICLNSDQYKESCHRYLQEILTTFRFYKVFLNDEYVSCMPVMTKVLTWMQTNLSIEKHFKEYVHMRLNMMYYKAIRQSISMLPSRTINDSNQMEARNMVGYTFGKYLAQEIGILKATYFESIQYMYKDIILKVGHFIHYCEIYTVSLINGLLDQSEDNILAIYLLKQKCILFGPKVRQDILLRLRKCENIEMQMILCDETFFTIGRDLPMRRC